MFVVTALMLMGCTSAYSQSSSPPPVATVRTTLEGSHSCNGDCGCDGQCGTKACACSASAKATGAQGHDACGCEKCEHECKAKGHCACDGASCGSNGCAHHPDGKTCGCGKKSAAAGAFSCPMHPEVQQASEGLCPKCNMKLARSE